MKEKQLQLLQETRDFFKENEWCQGELAKNQDGKETDVEDPNACKWCVYGALIKCGAGDYKLYNGALDIFLDSLPGGKDEWSIGAWNDAPERTKEEVLAQFDKALGINP